MLSQSNNLLFGKHLSASRVTLKAAATLKVSLSLICYERCDWTSASMK